MKSDPTRLFYFQSIGKDPRRDRFLKTSWNKTEAKMKIITSKTVRATQDNVKFHYLVICLMNDNG